MCMAKKGKPQKASIWQVKSRQVTASHVNDKARLGKAWALQEKARQDMHIDR